MSVCVSVSMRIDETEEANEMVVSMCVFEPAYVCLFVCAYLCVCVCVYMCECMHACVRFVGNSAHFS